jgi:hypothetical protein
MADPLPTIELDQIRARGVQLLALCSWGWIVLLGAIAVMQRDADVWLAPALTGWAEATRRLSTEVRSAATSLSGDVNALFQSTRAFVAQLRVA